MYLWNSQGSSGGVIGRWGHASMTLENGTHISWTPNDNAWWPIRSSPAREVRDLDEDIGREKGSPDLQIRILGLDEVAIEAWWGQFQRTHVWKTFSQNCATTIADALGAGKAPDWSVWNANAPVWSPAFVGAYARNLQRRLSGW